MNEDDIGFDKKPHFGFPNLNILGPRPMALALEDSDDEFKRNVDGTAIQKTRSLPAKRLGPLWAG